jgi:hypothetical protein
MINLKFYVFSQCSSYASGSAGGKRVESGARKSRRIQVTKAEDAEKRFVSMQRNLQVSCRVELTDVVPIVWSHPQRQRSGMQMSKRSPVISSGVARSTRVGQCRFKGNDIATTPPALLRIGTSTASQDYILASTALNNLISTAYASFESSMSCV